jgi:uncharacterized SAM-binding protein YcdF (DUF218 family)
MMSWFRGKHNGRLSTLVRVGTSGLLGLLFVIAAGHFLVFDEFELADTASIRGASVAVVFSGGHNRVDAGVRLLDQHLVPRMFISGMRSEEYFRTQFIDELSYHNPDVRDLDLLLKCCIEFGTLAKTTLQNGLETACWVSQRNVTGELLLITSRRHMARALAILRGFLPRMTIVPYPIEEAADASPYGMREKFIAYLEYWFSTLFSRAPVSLRPRAPSGPFAAGCPSVSPS